MGVSSAILSASFIFLMYGFGALLIKGNAKLFGMSIGVFTLAVAAQIIIAIWNES